MRSWYDRQACLQTTSNMGTNLMLISSVTWKATLRGHIIREILLMPITYSHSTVPLQLDGSLKAGQKHQSISNLENIPNVQYPQSLTFVTLKRVWCGLASPVPLNALSVSSSLNLACLPVLTQSGDRVTQSLHSLTSPHCVGQSGSSRNICFSSKYEGVSPVKWR